MNDQTTTPDAASDRQVTPNEQSGQDVLEAAFPPIEIPTADRDGAVTSEPSARQNVEALNEQERNEAPQTHAGGDDAMAMLLDRPAQDAVADDVVPETTVGVEDRCDQYQEASAEYGRLLSVIEQRLGADGWDLVGQLERANGTLTMIEERRLVEALCAHLPGVAPVIRCVVMREHGFDHPESCRPSAPPVSTLAVVSPHMEEPVQTPPVIVDNAHHRGQPALFTPPPCDDTFAVWYDARTRVPEYVQVDDSFYRLKAARRTGPVSDLRVLYVVQKGYGVLLRAAWEEAKEQAYRLRVLSRGSHGDLLPHDRKAAELASLLPDLMEAEHEERRRQREKQKSERNESR